MILGKEVYAHIVTVIVTIAILQLTGYNHHPSDTIASLPSDVLLKDRHHITVSLPYKPVVAVYGGSVTAGQNLLDRTVDRYAALLQEMMKDSIQVIFHGIGATGPDMHVVCGIPRADVIISEFTLNEHNKTVFDQWYKVTEQHAQHTTILSLWTWLNPPNETNPLSAPVVTLRDSVDSHPSRRRTFSILSMELLQLWDWRKLVPKYFARHAAHYETEVKVCFENAVSIDPLDQEAFVKCGRSVHPFGMQHGSELYHLDLATYLARHLQDVVFPLLDPDQSWVEDDRAAAENRSRQCIGEWGSFGAYPNWVDAIELQSGEFEVAGTVPRDVDKRTLRTNDPTAKIRLRCPSSSFQSARLGYIATNVPNDIAFFSVNGQNVSTALPDERRYHHDVHVMEFSKAFQPPLDIAVIDFASPTAILQFALLACSRETIDQVDTYAA